MQQPRCAEEDESHVCSVTARELYGLSGMRRASDVPGPVYNFHYSSPPSQMATAILGK